jgi:hypothetical protein
LVEQTGSWHYQKLVYGKPAERNSKSLDYLDSEYKSLLRESKFSLCPSGSGPNSIRIWESMSFGSIPVILADTLVLPILKNVDYTECFIFWKETEIDRLYDHLKSIDDDVVEKMSTKCIELFHRYFSKDSMELCIVEYFESNLT